MNVKQMAKTIIFAPITFRQNKDTKKGKKYLETWQCNMCGNKFPRKDALLFAGYELSPCCQNDNITKPKEHK
jgi:hypothetical protein